MKEILLAGYQPIEAIECPRVTAMPLFLQEFLDVRSLASGGVVVAPLSDVISLLFATGDQLSDDHRMIINYYILYTEHGKVTFRRVRSMRANEAAFSLVNHRRP